MPSLVLFGQQTFASGDDIQTHAIISILICIVELGLSIPIFAFALDFLKTLLTLQDIYDVLEDCTVQATTQALIVIFLALTIGLSSAGIIVFARMLQVSGKGTPTQPEKRSSLKWLCHGNIITFFCARIALVGIGMHLLRRLNKTCSCYERALGFVVYNPCTAYSKGFTSLLLCLVIFRIVQLFFDALVLFYIVRKLSHQLCTKEFRWNLCCRYFFIFNSIMSCCLSGGIEAIAGDFSDVAFYLSDFLEFAEVLDLTLSDIAAGLIMLKLVQEAKSNERMDDESEGKDDLENGAMDPLVKSCAIDQRIIAEGAHFLKFANAMYVQKTILTPRSCCAPRYDQFTGDNLLRTQEHALEKNLELGFEDIVYANFRSKVDTTPYCVVVDHDWKCVVVSIQGTKSLESMVADLKLRPASLEKVGKECGFDGTDKYAHSGMLACAQQVYRDIQQQRVLQTLFETDSKLSRYRLRLTGHSLGASVAAILGLMMKKEFPKLKCIAFSPPGCTLSLEGAKESENFTTTYILDDDFIGRFSISSMNNLRDDVLDVFARIKVPKREVMTLANSKDLGVDDVATTISKYLHKPGEVPRSKFYEEMERYLAVKKEKQQEDIQLFPPGKILHLVKTSEESFEKRGCLSRVKYEPKYKARWAKLSDFQEIRISSHFLDDHGPINLAAALMKQAEAFDVLRKKRRMSVFRSSILTSSVVKPCIAKDHFEAIDNFQKNGIRAERSVTNELNIDRGAAALAALKET